MRPIPCMRAGLAGGLLLLVMGGCSRTPATEGSLTAPTSPAAAILRAGAATGGDFYPLSPGNWWHYQDTFKAWSDDQLIEDHHSTITRQIVCAEPWMDREYVVERGVQTSDAGDVSRSWILERQDATGLYEADRSIQDRPACDPAPAVAATRMMRPDAGEGWSPSRTVAHRLQTIADPSRRLAALRAWQRIETRLALIRQAVGVGRPDGDPAAGEITRLRYPLHAGARWFIRDQETLQLEALVEGMETLQLRSGPIAAWRIRLVWHTPPFDPSDRIVMWYSRVGMMGYRYHLVSALTDENGNPIGGLEAEEDQRCDDFALAASGAAAARR